MHEHEHDREHDIDGGTRPRGDRVSSDDAVRLHHAAASGRLDVLGATGLLGLQRSAGNAAVSGLLEEETSPVLNVVGSGGGDPLESHTRQEMEGRLGADFGDVRVHTDSRAHDSARAVNAHAYTVGNDIVFQRDAFDTSSDQGKHTLAHELTHVIQQRNGPVDGTPAGGGIAVSDPSDRFEREAVAKADEVMASPVPAAASAPSAAAASASPAQSVQRCPGAHHGDGEMDEPVQRSVQRQEAGDEEDLPMA